MKTNTNAPDIDGTTEAEIYAPELPTASHVYFDDDGNPVAIATAHNPEARTDEQTETNTGTDYGGFLVLLTVGARSAEDIGKRAALLKFVMLPPDQRGTLEDLGRLLGVSKQRAHTVLTAFRKQLPQIANETGFSMPPIVSSY